MAQGSDYWYCEECEAMNTPTPRQVIGVLPLPSLTVMPLDALYWGAVASYDAMRDLHGADSPQCRRAAERAKALGAAVRLVEGVK